MQEFLNISILIKIKDCKMACLLWIALLLKGLGQMKFKLLGEMIEIIFNSNYI